MSDTMSTEASSESLQSLSDDDLRNMRRAMRQEMKRRGLTTAKKAGAGAGGKKAKARAGGKKAKRKAAKGA